MSAVPSSRHRITLSDVPQRVEVSYHGVVLADSDNVLLLRESGHAPVMYFPPGDVDQTKLTGSSHHTFCPFKGEASYYSLQHGERVVENIAWYYPEPIEGMERIRDHVAFYADQVTFKQE